MQAIEIGLRVAAKLQRDASTAARPRCAARPSGQIRGARPRGWRCAACICCLALGGCSDRLATLTGTVQYDGTPLSTGRVVFQPVGQGPTSYATIAKDGTYEAQTGAQLGIKPGEYLVAVHATETVAPSAGNPEPVPRSILPARYGDAAQSHLKVSVAQGANRYDIELGRL